MDLVHKLNLNKHPKDNENLSFVNALNVKVSADESCISNEESILENVFIKNGIINHFTKNPNDSLTFNKIIAVIPAINELILLVNVVEYPESAFIFRYREKTSTQEESIKCIHGSIIGGVNLKYSGLKYHGGIIKGAFTYNVQNELILSIAESGVEGIDIPLRVINLGEYNTAGYEDALQQDDKLAINPEIQLPTVNNVEYVKGSAYKGWYYLFFRYQINAYNQTYTQWYPIGFPIYVDTINKNGIIKYVFNRETHLDRNDAWRIIVPYDNKQGFCVGCTDNFSDETDIAQETFKIDFINPTNIGRIYQIGVVCCTKSYTKAFASININNYAGSNVPVSKGTPQQFIFDVNMMNEISVEELIADNYNPFNVKNIVNYQNRLYISNYTEHPANDDKIDESILSNIKITLQKEYFTEDSVAYDIPILKGGMPMMNANQYASLDDNSLPLYDYLGISPDTKVTVTEKDDRSITFTDVASHFIIGITDDKKWGYVNVIYNRYTGLGQVSQVIFDNAQIIIDGSIETINFDSDISAINGGLPYINTKLGFNTRKLNSTLIPGECYNFFIHFVDKYGHSTNGYKIENHIRWSVSYNARLAPPITMDEIIPYPVLGTDGVYYAAIPINEGLLLYDSINNKYIFNTLNIQFYKNIDYQNHTLSEVVTQGTDVLYNNLCDKSFLNEKYFNFKWHQVIESADRNNFNVFINSKDERLFKVPMSNTFIKTNVENEDIQAPSKYNYIHIRNMIRISGVVIPDGYIGYFISYEKYEPIRRFSGLLTRADFISQSSYDVLNPLDVANKKKSSTMMFYSGQLDIADSIKNDFNLLRIESINGFDTMDIPVWDHYQRTDGFDYCYDMNKPLLNTLSDISVIYPMPDYTIAVGGSSTNNRIGLGTGIQIKDSYNLFPEVIGTGLTNLEFIKQYYVTILNSTRNIYTNDNKILIPLSQVIYDTKELIIENGYNGHWTYDGVLVYENSGVLFNDADKKVRRISDNSEFYKSEVTSDKPHTYENDIPFAAYVQFPVCDTVFYESKRFKNKPDPIVYITYLDEKVTEDSRYAKGVMVTPANSIDLFENTQGSAERFYPKTYSNFATFKSSVREFNKTVRRSNIIQDESTHNSWKKFPLEAYKNISENKGNITNIVGIGYLFLVHTEHSLFMFDTNNMIKAVNTDLQITQPDAFDVDYKEVFSSTLGYGGLQDDKSWIVNQNGYIFYNNDVNRFYRFDNNQLAMIDDDIIQWLLKYKPYNVRFADDKINNRLLISMNYTINNIEKSIVISYNYKIDNFISLHSYYFKEAFNTKTQLYLQCTDIHNSCSLHQFVQDGSSYGQYDNIINNIGNSITQPSKISIIVNPEYINIKTLDYITYKLNKLVNDVNIDYTIHPVEESKQPFSGNLIKVYNNQVNTGNLDISIDFEESKNAFGNYQKPYWYLGNWNFNYLRNNISNHEIKQFVDNYSKLFGNYFIIEFTFNNEDNLKVEFEELDYKLIK